MNALTLVVLMSCAQTDTPDSSFLMWPDNIGRFVRQSVGSKDRPLGYSSQQMANFPGRAYGLGYVSQMFAAAESVPDETNRLARRMLDSSFERALYRALAILGSKISLDVQQDKPAPEIVPADEKSKAAWEALPESVREAVTEIVRGAAAARPYLHEAFDWNAIARQTGCRAGEQARDRAGIPSRGRSLAGLWRRERIVCGTEQFQGHAVGKRGRRVLLLGAIGHSQPAGRHAGRRDPEVRFVAAQDQCGHGARVGTGEQHVSGVGCHRGGSGRR